MSEKNYLLLNKHLRKKKLICEERLLLLKNAILKIDKKDSLELRTETESWEANHTCLLHLVPKEGLLVRVFVNSDTLTRKG